MHEFPHSVATAGLGNQLYFLYIVVCIRRTLFHSHLHNRFVMGNCFSASRDQPQTASAGAGGKPVTRKATKQAAGHSLPPTINEKPDNARDAAALAAEARKKKHEEDTRPKRLK